MSEKKRTIIGGLDKFRSARGNAGVDNAQSSLNSAFEQQEQAHQGLDQIEEEISQAQKAVKDARKAEKAQKRAAMVEIFDGVITIPTRIIGAVAGVCNAHPKKTILPTAVAILGFNIVDTDNLPSVPSVAMPTTSFSQQDNIQVASLKNNRDAISEATRLSKKFASIEFEAVGNTVQTPNSCPELILNGVVGSQAQCELGMTLAKR